MTARDDKFLGTVLVTGGAGIVGSYVIEELVKNPYCSKVVATYHSAKSHQHACDNVEYHVCDTTNATEVKSLLDQTHPKLIIPTVSPGPWAPADIQHQVNYLATKEIVIQAKEHQAIQALIYTSSLSAVYLYPASRGKAQTEEESELNSLESSGFINAYGRTKGAADAFVLAANTGQKTNEVAGDFRGQLLTATLRVGGLYGERDLKTIFEMLKVVNTPATRFQIGPDNAMHEWVHTSNVAQAHILAAEALLDGLHTEAANRVDGEAFFVTDDSPMPFWEFSRKVWIAAGDNYLNSSKTPRIMKVPFWLAIPIALVIEIVYKLFGQSTNELKLDRLRLEYIKHGCRLSVDKAKSRLDYKPICNTEDGIKKSVAWFLKKENEFWFQT